MGREDGLDRGLTSGSRPEEADAAALKGFVLAKGHTLLEYSIRNQDGVAVVFQSPRTSRYV